MLGGRLDWFPKVNFTNQINSLLIEIFPDDLAYFIYGYHPMQDRWDQSYYKLGIIGLIALLSLSNLIASSATAKLRQRVCSIGGDSVSIDELVNNSTPLDTEGYPYYELIMIKRLFGETYSGYSLRISDHERVASAILHSDVEDDLERTLVINHEYYSNLFRTNQNKKAIITFILTHEFFHHKNGDLFYSRHRGRANRLKREILADERAGYAVAKLQPRVDIGFFDYALPKVFSSTNHTKTHPARKYRIMAAKGGWLRGKLDDLDISSGPRIKSLAGVTYQIRTISGGTQYGRLDKDQFIGDTVIDCHSTGIFFGKRRVRFERIAERNYPRYSLDGVYIFLSSRYDFSGIYFGEGQFISSSGTVIPDGNGHYFHLNDDEYLGHYDNGYRNGFGSMIYSDTYADRYSRHQNTAKAGEYYGYWNKGKKHGLGIMKKPNEKPLSGEWKQDKLIENFPVEVIDQKRIERTHDDEQLK